MPTVTRDPAGAAEAPAAAYGSGLEHLEDELRLLDRVLLRAVVAPGVAPPGLDGHQGLYIAREEVELLLDPAWRPESGHAVPAAGASEHGIGALRAAIDAAVTAAHEAGVRLPLPQLAARLGLSDVEQRILLLCLAPELDRKYDRVYAYLQDDLTRKRPSVDLVTELVTTTRHDRWRALRLLSPHAPLLRSGALRVVEDHDSPSGSSALAQLLQVSPVIVAHVLDDPQLDPELAGAAHLLAPAAPHGTRGDGERIEQLVRLVDHLLREETGGLVVHLHGAEGAGQIELAYALAAALGTPLVEVDCASLPARPDEMAAAVEAALRNGWLAGVPVLLRGADRVVRPPDGWTREHVLDASLGRFPGLVLIAAEQPWPSRAAVPGCTLHEVRLDAPDLEARRATWDEVMAGGLSAAEQGWAARLAGQFRLNAGQIRDVAAQVRREAVAGDRAPGLDDWTSACRRRAGRALDGLARRVPTTRSWADLVLEPDRIAVLREICDQVRLRDAVLDDWGLGRLTAAARGLSVLFAGPPGTGKSMSAEVVASELELDLYRIDLSQVVSKYIGETEKNLSRVFAAAEDSGAVLLFDEADALFGTRTEISDAHDRYANIETSYLLQRMEEYDGIAVLSTNLRQNMDEAFLRRLRFVLEFPLPDVAERRRIWASHLRGDLPLADDVDLALLARRLPVAGGSIRNIVLAAAFLAAAQGRAVAMADVVSAARREFDKIGKLWRDLGDSDSGSTPATSGRRP